MHELAITTSLLETVQARAQAEGVNRVVAINLVAGERSGIVDDSVRFYLEQLAPGTSVEGAQLTVRHVPMRFFCERCTAEYLPRGADFECPACHHVGNLIDDGTALFIESIQVET